MKKRLAIVASVLSLALLAPVSADGVEFGQDATGDPNAVKVGGASGFLYSERIVITVAHIFGRNQDEVVRSLPYWEREGVIYNPGIVTIAGQKQYKIKKILIPSTFVYPDYQNNIMTDDLAIVILSEDIPVTKKAVLATEEQMKRFVIEKSKVELVGYGITNGSQRDQLGGVISGLPFSNRPPNKLTSTLISPEMVINFYKQYPNVDWKRINRPGVYGIVQHRELKQSHICDGDSGSMFFVEEDNVRYLLGTTGLGLVNNNCPPPEYPFSFPSMSWIDPASKLPTLLKTAEAFVADEKQRELKEVEEAKAAAELKTKQEAEEKARVEAELKAKLEAEAKIAAEAAAKVAADATLLAKKKSEDLAKKRYLGKTCAKLKSAKTVSGVKFICVKTGKKLVWALR